MFFVLFSVGTLHLQHNDFNGEIPESLCSSLTQLKDFYADCLESSQSSTSASLQCTCCTHCCSSDIIGECVIQDRFRMNSDFNPYVQPLYDWGQYQQFSRLYKTPSISLRASPISPPSPVSLPLATKAPMVVIPNGRISKSSKKSDKGSKGSKGSKGKSDKNISTDAPAQQPDSGKGKSKKNSNKSKGKGIYTSAPTNSPSPTSAPTNTPTTCPDDDLDCNPRPGLGAAGSKLSFPSVSPSEEPCIVGDLDDCERPTNPTDSKTPSNPVQGSPPSSSTLQSSSSSSSSNNNNDNNEPKLGGSSGLLDEPPQEEKFYSYTDCDDLDFCNRPTNPTHEHYRKKKNDVSSAIATYGGYGGNDGCWWYKSIMLCIMVMFVFGL